MESSHRQSHGVSHSGTTIYIYMPNDSIMLTCSRTCMESSRFRVRRVDNGPGTGPMVDVPEHSELKLYSGMETDYSNSVPDLHGASSTSQLYTPEPQERKISLVHLTREALPRLDNYRNCKSAIKRPSIGELHGEFRVSGKLKLHLDIGHLFLILRKKIIFFTLHKILFFRVIFTLRKIFIQSNIVNPCRHKCILLFDCFLYQVETMNKN